jgi:hypothetical protein
MRCDGERQVEEVGRSGERGIVVREYLGSGLRTRRARRVRGGVAGMGDTACKIRRAACSVRSTAYEVGRWVGESNGSNEPWCVGNQAARGIGEARQEERQRTSEEAELKAEEWCLALGSWVAGGVRRGWREWREWREWRGSAGIQGDVWARLCDGLSRRAAFGFGQTRALSPGLRTRAASSGTPRVTVGGLGLGQ